MATSEDPGARVEAMFLVVEATQGVMPTSQDPGAREEAMSLVPGNGGDSSDGDLRG